MMRHKILYTVLITSFSSSPLLANAQTIAPMQNYDPHAPASAQRSAAPIRDSPAAVENDSPAIAPMNVLVDFPPGMGGERPGALCDNDLVTGQMPAGCRRWSQIAGEVRAYMADVCASGRRLVAQFESLNQEQPLSDGASKRRVLFSGNRTKLPAFI
jgi:hypothetical protein